MKRGTVNLLIAVFGASLPFTVVAIGSILDVDWKMTATVTAMLVGFVVYPIFALVTLLHQLNHGDEIGRVRKELELAQLDASVAGTDRKAYWNGMDAGCFGTMQRWREALSDPIPKPGTLGSQTMEDLYRETERLREQLERCEAACADLRALLTADV